MKELYPGFKRRSKRSRRSENKRGKMKRQNLHSSQTSIKASLAYGQKIVDKK